MVAVLALIAALAVLLTLRWPFTPQAVIEALQNQSHSRVHVASFRRLYFPHPGAVAEELTFRRDTSISSPPLIAIQRLTIQTSYLGLLTHHIRWIAAEGLRVTIPPPDTAGKPLTGSSAQTGTTSAGLVIDHLVANGARVEFPVTAERSAPLIFTAKALSLHSIADSNPLSFDAVVLNPEPPGQIHVSGQIGPWKSGDADHTPLSGSYTFDGADLGVFTGIAGVLTAKGKFEGVLDHINTEGTVTVPDFETTRAGHPMALTTQFHALVNGTNGDVALTPFRARLARTNISGTGEIEGDSKLNGKTVTLQVASHHGRVQDLLRLFLKGDPPPMVGPVDFRANVVLPPEKPPFLKRVQLEGDFGVTGARYTKATTQQNLDLASAKARGQADKIEDDQDADKKDGADRTDQDLEHVVSNVKGHVILRNGVAAFSHLSFDVPGASAHVSGTYSLLNQQINMHGIVAIDAPLAHATTGAKSFLLKIVQPLTRKKRNTGTGSVVALRVTGTYSDPSFLVTPMVHK